MTEKTPVRIFTAQDAQAAWDHPGWAEAAKEFRQNRPPVDPRIRGTFEQMCEIADQIERAKRHG